jgi:hypothetical protein
MYTGSQIGLKVWMVDKAFCSSISDQKKHLYFTTYLYIAEWGCQKWGMKKYGNLTWWNEVCVSPAHYPYSFEN